MGSKHGLSKWVFPDEVGKPTRKDCNLRSEFRKVVKAAGVPRLSFHGLRRTHATMLASRGVSVKAVQERLGHSDVRMTLDVYTQVTMAMQEQVVAALDAFHQSIEGGSASISGQKPLSTSA
jgi:integrase